MKKFSVLIVLVAIICIGSGAYAIMSDNNNISNTTDVNVNNSVVDDVSDDVSVDLDVARDVEPIFSQDDIDFNTPIKHYIGKYSYYIGDGIIDHYTDCVECGGFIPIGKVTNPLPDAALCHHNMAKFIYNDYYISLSYTRDEAYQKWVSVGKPVFDDGSIIHEDHGDSGDLTDEQNNYYRMYSENGTAYIVNHYLEQDHAKYGAHNSDDVIEYNDASVSENIVADVNSTI